MFEKIAALADFADKTSQYELADDLTYLVKNAQLFDALKTLLDPSAGALGDDASFWKRLTRGWKSGKFDRRLGLAFAINEEREKLNKKILALSEPLKGFSDQVAAFYDKVRTGSDNYSAQDFKAELSALKGAVSKMKSLVGGRELRKALDMRNKLNAQQITAIERIKGIDPEKKEFLIKLLRGEMSASPAAAQQAAVPGQVTPADKTSPEQKEIRTWLKKLPIPGVDYAEGLTHPRSRGAAWTYYQRWGFNPLAIKRYFEEHAEKMDEGAEIFGKPFRKVFTDVDWVLGLEKAHAAKPAEKPPVVAPVKETPAVSEESPVARAREQAKRDLENAEALEKQQKSSPAGTPIPLLATPPVPTQKAERRKNTKRDKELTTQIQEALSGEKKQPEAPKAAPANDELSLAATAAQRLERQITRLGRGQQLRKIADDLLRDEEILDVLDPIGGESEDLMDVGLGEPHDEEKDYDQNELMLNMMGPGADEYESPEDKLDQKLEALKQKYLED